ncbi:hypothetical protein JOQ06_014089, partial [Pogonophryne albipinna]
VCVFIMVSAGVCVFIMISAGVCVFIVVSECVFQQVCVCSSWCQSVCSRCVFIMISAECVFQVCVHRGVRVCVCVFIVVSECVFQSVCVCVFIVVSECVFQVCVFIMVVCVCVFIVVSECVFQASADIAYTSERDDEQEVDPQTRRGSEYLNVPKVQRKTLVPNELRGKPPEDFRDADQISDVRFKYNSFN